MTQKLDLYVCIPTCDRHHLLAQTLRAIVAFFEHQKILIEILVVDSTGRAFDMDEMRDCSAKIRLITAPRELMIHQKLAIFADHMNDCAPAMIVGDDDVIGLSRSLLDEFRRGAFDYVPANVVTVISDEKKATLSTEQTWGQVLAAHGEIDRRTRLLEFASLPGPGAYALYSNQTWKRFCYFITRVSEFLCSVDQRFDGLCEDVINLYLLSLNSCVSSEIWMFRKYDPTTKKPNYTDRGEHVLSRNTVNYLKKHKPEIFSLLLNICVESWPIKIEFSEMEAALISHAEAYSFGRTRVGGLGKRIIFHKGAEKGWFQVGGLPNDARYLVMGEGPIELTYAEKALLKGNWIVVPVAIKLWELSGMDYFLRDTNYR